MITRPHAESTPISRGVHSLAATAEVVAAPEKIKDAAPQIVDTKVSAPSLRAAATPSGPRLINVLGSIVWGLLDFALKVVGGQPVVPAGLSVSAGRGKLAIDCGPGRVVDADWYYPQDGHADKLIYFQHGLLVNAAFYNETLAELADRNNAIVVAPSITSNKFDCYDCTLFGDSMHAAVAQLFIGDHAALAASAAQAGYQGVLPDRFVFAGQSAGALLASGAAGYYYQSAPADQKSSLVGVLLYDSSAGTSVTTGSLPRALAKLPLSLPVLQIAAEPSYLDLYGTGNQALTDLRPGQFNGVELVGGVHSDGFRTTKYGGLVQFSIGFFAGFSRPENVEAVQDLSQGWITDMYAGTVYNPAERTGIYGTPGSVIDIHTQTGKDAHADVLPGPPVHLTLIQRLIDIAFTAYGNLNFAYCATQPATETSHQSAGVAHQCAARRE